MSQNRSIIGLDIGSVRIGVSVANLAIKIAIPFTTIEVDGSEVEQIAKIILDQDADKLVIGYPRNQSGETTKQTESVEKFADQLKDMDVEIVFQDESLTSVMAEERLNSRGGKFTKGDIDSEAAAIILQDYLEVNR